MRIGFLCLGLIFLMSLMIPNLVLGDWYNQSWDYRREINISNTAGNLTNYQEKLSINTTLLYEAGKLNLTCKDIRFTNSTDDKMDLWEESCITNDNSTNSSFWVELPFLENATNTSIYTYYGNSEATSESNGTNTFIVFDDFEDGDISDWTQNSIGGWAVNNSFAYQGNNSLYNTGKGTGDSSRRAIWTTKYNGTGSIAMEEMIYISGLSMLGFSARADDTQTAKDIRFLSAEVSYSNFDQIYDRYHSEFLVVRNPNHVNSLKWYKVKMTYNSNRTYCYHVNSSDTEWICGTDSVQPGSEGDRWGVRAYQDNSYVNYGFVDNFFIRKYASPEPTYTIGSEEEGGDSTNPTSNTPSDASYTQNSAQTIGWILQDETGVGNYTILRNGSIQNASTSWTNNTNLNVWVNTTTIGNNWNYTINFNDSAGNDGTPDTVFINITDGTAPTYSDNSTNSTVAGTNILHSLKWQDETALSGYIFSFCNGTWNGSSCEFGHWTTGKVGNALFFEGDSIGSYGTGTYIDCGNDSSLQPTNEITIDTWIKPDCAQEDEQNRGIASSVQNWSMSSSWSWQIRYGYNLTHPYLGFQLHTNISTGWAKLDQNLTDDTWYHIVATFNGSHSKIYLDSVLKDTHDFGTSIIDVNSANKILIGNEGWANYFNGTIDEFRIYNRTLNATEINWSYQRGSSGLVSNVSTTGLVGYWDLDEGSGTTTDDSSPVGTNDGTLTNFVFDFTNDSWAAMSGVLNWSNVTKSVDSTVEHTIAWKVYANDTSNNWNTSDTYTYVTTSADTCTYTSGNWAITCSDNCSFASTDVGGNNVTITGSGGYAKGIMNITNYTSFVISGGCSCFAKDG